VRAKIRDAALDGDSAALLLYEPRAAVKMLLSERSRRAARLRSALSPDIIGAAERASPIMAMPCCQFDAVCHCRLLLDADTLIDAIRRLITPTPRYAITPQPMIRRHYYAA